MEYIRITKDNLEKEHICCAISNNKDVQVSSKKAWMADRFDEGLVFLKSAERGKCFIEYIPAENAWTWILLGSFKCMHRGQQRKGTKRAVHFMCSKEKAIPSRSEVPKVQGLYCGR